MIQYRLVSGFCLTGFVLGVFWLDHRLDTLTVTGFLNDLFGGKGHYPPGLPFVALIFLILPLAARELAAMFRALDIQAEAWLLSLAAIGVVLGMYLVPSGSDAAITAPLMPLTIEIPSVVPITSSRPGAPSTSARVMAAPAPPQEPKGNVQSSVGAARFPANE